jgi:hypothetical protein
MAFTVAAAVVAYSYFPSAELRKMLRGYRPAAILTSNNDMGIKPAKDQTSLTSSTEATVLPERQPLERVQTTAEEPAANTASTEAPALPVRTQLLDSGAGGQGIVVTTTPTTLPSLPVTPRTREAAPEAEQGSTQAVLALKPAAAAAESEAAPAEVRFVAVVFTHQDRDAALDAFADLRQRYPNLLARRKPEAQPIEIGDKGTWHRVVVLPAGTRQNAFALCDRLELAGYDRCWVKAY